MTATMPTTSPIGERPPRRQDGTDRTDSHGRPPSPDGDEPQIQPVEGWAGPGRRIVVGYSGSAASEAALVWAARSLGGRDHLLVVHATSVPVTVVNGPSAAVAESLGHPTWATMRSMVEQLVGTDRADTIVDHGSAYDVLTHHAADADLLVIGRGARRSRLVRRLERAFPGAVVARRADGTGAEAIEHLTHPNPSNLVTETSETRLPVTMLPDRSSDYGFDRAAAR